jgi:hypothetical protein
MPPLPDQVSVLLRSSSTAALAALMLISTSHRGLFDWFSRTVCADAPAELEPHPRKSNGAARRGRKANGYRKPRDNGGDCRLPARDEADKRLLEAMRKNPDGVINDWVMVVGKSRSSVVSALHRLRDSGLAESIGGKWRLTEALAPREPAQPWIQPLKATHERTRRRDGQQPSVSSRSV